MCARARATHSFPTVKCAGRRSSGRALLRLWSFPTCLWDQSESAPFTSPSLSKPGEEKNIQIQIENWSRFFPAPETNLFPNALPHVVVAAQQAHRTTGACTRTGALLRRCPCTPTRTLCLVSGSTVCFMHACLLDLDVSLPRNIFLLSLRSFVCLRRS